MYLLHKIIKIVNEERIGMHWDDRLLVPKGQNKTLTV